MPQSLATPLKNGLTGIEENSMYYVTTRRHGDMMIWQHVKKLRSFKATDGVEYIIAKNKKEILISCGS